MITLGEGNTPLLPAPRLSERFGVELWLKWEGANPTGSFKDRGMTMAVTRAVEQVVTLDVARDPSLDRGPGEQHREHGGMHIDVRSRLCGGAHDAANLAAAERLHNAHIAHIPSPQRGR